MKTLPLLFLGGEILTPDEMKAKAWKFLRSQGLTEEGAAGLMGNLERESDGFCPNRVEYLCLRRLKEIGKIYTHATYTAFVDDGTISREDFVHPLPGKQYGYGLAQWTTPVRKGGLYDLCKSRKVSIADLQTQLDYLMMELRTNYQAVYQTLLKAHSVDTASDIVLKQFEQPAMPENHIQARRSSSRAIYDKFHAVEEMVNVDAIQKAIQIAENEIGYLEKSNGANLDDKVKGASSGNWTKYWRDVYPLYQGQPWCAVFISWILMVAFGLETAKKLLLHWPFVYCPTLAGKTSNKVPKVGSIILFFRSGAYAHTGLVIGVTSDTITTIEGNTSGEAGVVPNGGGVFRKTYKRSDISGMTKYFMPDYSLVEEEKEMMYYVRSSWLDISSQVMATTNLGRAKAAAKKNKQLYVFNAIGKIEWPIHKTVKAQIERAVQWENAVTRDPRHGYDNTESGRWGQKGDYACSTLQIIAYQQAGVPVKDKGASVTANMRDIFLRCGFEDVTAHVNFKTCQGMLRGDILLTPGRHTEMYIGSKRLIGARGNAYGDGPEHGKPGDQGGEIVKGEYYNFPWEFCLRYVGIPADTIIQCGSYEQKGNAATLQKRIADKTKVQTIIVKVDRWYTVRTKGMTRDEAKEVQTKLLKAGFDAILI